MFRALKNTIVISLLKLVFCFPAPIFLAILLNEVHSQRYRKTLQWMVYLPYFISWVVIGGIVKQLLAVDDGLFNNIHCGHGKRQGGFPAKFLLFLSDPHPHRIVEGHGVGYGHLHSRHFGD